MMKSVAEESSTLKAAIAAVFAGLVYYFAISQGAAVDGLSLPVALAACIVFAVVMPVVGGVAPLLLPNAAMPADVRLVHGIEITVSYIIYGAALGYLLYPQSQFRPAPDH